MLCWESKKYYFLVSFYFLPFEKSRTYPAKQKCNFRITDWEAGSGSIQWSVSSVIFPWLILAHLTGDFQNPNKEHLEKGDLYRLSDPSSIPSGICSIKLGKTFTIFFIYLGSLEGSVHEWILLMHIHLEPFSINF